MTLTFNLATWFLFATHHLIMMIICAILYSEIHSRMTKLLAGHKQLLLKHMHKVQGPSVTLTFNLATWFLFATHLIMIIICANLYFEIQPRMTKLLAGHKQILLKLMHKVKERTVSLTFNLATWFLFATHHLIMLIICAQLFSIPTMHYKVMDRTRTGFTEVYAQSLRADCDR